MTTVAPIVSFTPSAMAPEVLEAIFVQHEPLVKRILATIRASARSQAKHHWLLVGPRGIGKTHIVSIVHYRLSKNVNLKKKLAIAWLREDSWEIASYFDLLEAILRSLGADLPASPDAAHAEEELLRALGGRALLVIAENLDEVFNGIGLAGQRSLRAFIETHDNVVLLATSPALFSGVSLHRSPFYGFFTVEHLSELDLAAATELLDRIALLRGDTELHEFLQTETAARRLRVVAELAGGHPRIWVLFATCLSLDLIDELVPLFVKMLDDLTPYYQGRMRSLPPQQRRIVMQLATHGGAQPVRDIAQALRLDPRSVAKQLGDLEQKAFVRKADLGPIAATGDRRLSAYELREPLLRLSLDIKESRGKPIRLIVEFLRAWYGKDLVEFFLHQAPLATTYITEALSGLLTKDEVATMLESVWARTFQLLALQMTLVVLSEFSGVEVAHPPARSATSGFPLKDPEMPGLRRWARDVVEAADRADQSRDLAVALMVSASLLMNRETASRLVARFTRDEPWPVGWDPVPGGRVWVAIWEDATGGNEEVQIPLRLLHAAVAWAGDHDRKRLLALPTEERRILQSLMPGQAG